MVSKMRASSDDRLAAALRHGQLAADQVRRRGQHGALGAQHLDVDARLDELAERRFQLARRDVLGLQPRLPMLGPDFAHGSGPRARVSRSSMLLDRFCCSVKYSSALNASSVSASSAPYHRVRRVRSDTPRCEHAAHTRSA